MTAKEELTQYKEKIADVDRTIQEYEKYLTRATKMNAVITEMTSRTNMPSDKVGDNAIKMAELSKEYVQRWFLAEQERLNLIDEIGKVGGRHGNVLYHVYVEGLSLERTADAMGYAYDTITHLHKDALDLFERRNDYVNTKPKKN